MLNVLTQFLAARAPCSAGYVRNVLLAQFIGNGGTCTRTNRATQLISLSRFASKNPKTAFPPCAQSIREAATNIPEKNVYRADYRELPWTTRIFLRLVAGYRDYGLTALTFHAVVAGISIGFWWSLVYNGYDVEGWLARLGFISPFQLLLSHLSQAFGAKSFPLAYAIHKATAPLRAVLTLIVTPFIVRNLRKRHIFKLPPEYGMRKDSRFSLRWRTDRKRTRMPAGTLPG